MTDVKAMIQEFRERWPNAEWGPAHIVLSDYNLEDGWIDSCLESIRLGDTAGHPTREIEATGEFLRTLRLIPESERTAWYADSEEF